MTSTEKDSHPNTSASLIPSDVAERIIQSLKDAGFPADVDAHTNRIAIEFPAHWTWLAHDRRCGYIGFVGDQVEWHILSNRWWALFGYGDREFEHEKLSALIPQILNQRLITDDRSSPSPQLEPSSTDAQDTTVSNRD